MIRYCFLLLTLFLFSCSSNKRVKDYSSKSIEEKKERTQKVIEKENKRSKEELILIDFNEHFIFKEHHAGFVLFDLEKKKTILEQDGNKLFTPASNIKLFTLYTALKFLDAKESLIQYKETDEALYFKGTGHPAFLHPYLPKESQAFDFLNASRKNIYYCADHFDDEVFNPGWAIDDAPFYYQTDKSAFPMFGNISWLSRAKGQMNFKIVPPTLKKHLKKTKEELSYPLRSFDDNTILLSDSLRIDKDWSMDIPFKSSDQLITAFLNDTLNRKVDYGCINDMHDRIPDYPTDALYKMMMQKSDNHIAEQLLLMCSAKQFDTLNTSRIIQYALDSLMSEIPDQPRWVDGSGLSRYNLASPQSLVWVLEKIRRRLGTNLIERYFEEIYLDEAKTVTVFAKTGSLSNNFCLSGYLKSKSGKLFAFSIMNNHFVGSRKELYKEVKKFLLKIVDQY